MCPLPCFKTSSRLRGDIQRGGARAGELTAHEPLRSNRCRFTMPAARAWATSDSMLSLTYCRIHRFQGVKAPEILNTHCRSSVVLPDFINCMFGVHNGKDYVPIEVKEAMIGHKLGELQLVGNAYVIEQLPSHHRGVLAHKKTSNPQAEGLWGWGEENQPQNWQILIEAFADLSLILFCVYWTILMLSSPIH